MYICTFLELRKREGFSLLFLKEKKQKNFKYWLIPFF